MSYGRNFRGAGRIESEGRGLGFRVNKHSKAVEQTETNKSIDPWSRAVCFLRKSLCDIVQLLLYNYVNVTKVDIQSIQLSIYTVYIYFIVLM